jgi:hypothetical protein
MALKAHQKQERMRKAFRKKNLQNGPKNAKLRITRGEYVQENHNAGDWWTSIRNRFHTTNH